MRTAAVGGDVEKLALHHRYGMRIEEQGLDFTSVFSNVLDTSMVDVWGQTKHCIVEWRTKRRRHGAVRTDEDIDLPQLKVCFDIANQKPILCANKHTCIRPPPKILIKHIVHCHYERLSDSLVSEVWSYHAGMTVCKEIEMRWNFIDL
jgi:hypothetical protein